MENATAAQGAASKLEMLDMGNSPQKLKEIDAARRDFGAVKHSTTGFSA
jgi:hypothetical protein